MQTIKLRTKVATAIRGILSEVVERWSSSSYGDRRACASRAVAAAEQLTKAIEIATRAEEQQADQGTLSRRVVELEMQLDEKDKQCGALFHLINTTLAAMNRDLGRWTRGREMAEMLVEESGTTEKRRKDQVLLDKEFATVVVSLLEEVSADAAAEHIKQAIRRAEETEGEGMSK